MSDLIERARMLAQAATPGPWHHGDRNPPNYFWGGIISVRDDIMYKGECVLFEANPNFPVEGEANAEFVAASRELVPQLCDALEQAQSEAARLREALEWYANRANYDGGKPGELHDLLNCKPSVQYWKADNGERARRALEMKP